MAAWTEGYVADIEYSADYFRELMPNFLHLVCTLYGVQAPPVDEPFTYCELGCGRGVSLLMAAAAYPNGKFFGFDFNPAELVGVRAIAKAAGLDNVVFEEKSFAELAADALSLPSFDYVVCHGIFSWVNAENRQLIVDFCRRHTKTGGVVYNSYNVMPGWASASPLQRLIRGFANQLQHRSDIRVKHALGQVHALREAGASFFSIHAAADAWLKSAREASVNTLVHEYLPDDCAAHYFEDVSNAMAAAKLSYVGQASPQETSSWFVVTEAAQAFLANIPSESFREQLRDYFNNRTFRRDVYVRGAHSMSEQEVSERVSNYSFALIAPRDSVSREFSTLVGDITAPANLQDPVVTALAKGPTTIESLRRTTGLTRPQVLQTIVLLIGAGHVSPTLPAGDPSRAIALNRIIAEESRRQPSYDYFAAPGVGGGVRAHIAERLMLAAIHHGHTSPSDIATFVWASLQYRGMKLTRAGRRLETEAEHIGMLREATEVWLSSRRELLVSLGAVESRLAPGTNVS